MGKNGAQWCTNADGGLISSGNVSGSTFYFMACGGTYHNANRFRITKKVLRNLIHIIIVVEYLTLVIFLVIGTIVLVVMLAKVVLVLLHIILLMIVLVRIIRHIHKVIILLQ